MNPCPFRAVGRSGRAGAERIETMSVLHWIGVAVVVIVVLRLAGLI